MACIQAGVKFPDEDVEVFSSSWTRAVKETNRMLEHIKTLRPHGVNNTLSMNDARCKVVAMSRPMAEMTVAIQKNIREAKEAQAKAKLADTEAVDFEKQLHVEGVDLEFKDLGFPRTVCTHSDCIEYISAGRDNVKQVNYKQHCHSDCSLPGVPTETVGDSRLQRCAAMSDDNNCSDCSHSYKLHMHRTYDLVTVKRSFISEEVQRKIQDKKDAKSRMEAAVNEMINLVNEFETEQAKVYKVNVTYGSFLKDAAMIPYNDAIGDYLDMTIKQEEEKQPLLRDPDLINRLHLSKKAYEEEKAVIENALAHQEPGQGTGFSLTPKQMEELQEDLFKMKHFGQSLKNIFYSIKRGDRANYEHRKVVYDTVGWRSRALEFINPIKDLVVRGIKLVRTSETGEYKIEKKRRTDNKAQGTNLTGGSAVGHGVSLEEMDSAADVNKEDGDEGF